MKQAGCPLCDAAGGRLVLATPHWRLIHAQEPGFPAFYRLVWNDHVREFSQLEADQRSACMEALVAIERGLLAQLGPTKINLATLGNVVPHLHWHVIARFEWDSHFPGPVWAAAQREADVKQLADVAAKLPALEQHLIATLAASA
jgi:diadenosine tetraphosphate (Ap4A) HIT family hydrolase